jgi:hypothetical protein
MLGRGSGALLAATPAPSSRVSIEASSSSRAAGTDPGGRLGAAHPAAGPSRHTRRGWTHKEQLMKLFREFWRGGIGALALIIAMAAPAWATDATGAAPPPDQGAAGPVSPMPTSQQGMVGALLPHPFAPLGVPGAHVLRPGRWQVSYTYGHMRMDGNLVGTNEVSVADILKKYPVAPESMTVNMNMISGMRGITENFTVMAMLPYYFKSMTMVMRNGTRFTTNSDGIGDLQLGGLYSLYRSATHQFVLFGGLGLPTGSINARDATPTAQDAKLGYTMQLGSGTVDLLPALTYLGKFERFHWGAQASGTVRLGENYNDYRLGDRYRVTGWTGYQIYDGLVGSLRLDWQSWGDIHGADPDLDPRKTPGQDPDLRAGDRLDFLAGLAWYLDQGPLAGNRLFIEGGVPVYQCLDGPQGKTTWLLSAGWKFVF